MAVEMVWLQCKAFAASLLEMQGSVRVDGARVTCGRWKGISTMQALQRSQDSGCHV